MAITDKEKGVWGLDQVYNKINQGSIWEYSGVPALFVWGSNDKGKLAQNNNEGAYEGYSSPVQIPGTTWQYLSQSGQKTDSRHAFATKTDGTLWSWGYNSKGQLGHNSRTQYSSPVQIPGTTWGPYMEVSGQSSFAIKTDGTLWAWGMNDSGYGRLGLNNKTNYSSPVQIPGTTWAAIDTANYFTTATKTDGTLWTWGYGGYGRLGLNSNTNYSSPKQVPGTTWGTSISSGNYGAGVVKTDGTLWMWGYNSNGEVGQNNRTAYSSPRQIPGTTWSKISCQYFSTLAIKTDGTLWVWGNNDQGNLGLNSRTTYSSPVQIPGTTWNDIISTYAHSSVATKTDGTLWSWGPNGYGQLGQNNTTKYSSPTQIIGNWKASGLRQMGSTQRGYMVIKEL